MKGTTTLNAGGIQINCISQEASSLLDKIMEDWDVHYKKLKLSDPKHEPSYYGFAYWLVRWSGLIQPSQKETGV